MDQLAFRSLAYTDIITVLNCFNDSFREYYVPLQLTKEQFADKIYAEAIDMKLSYGAFENDKLVGFILHGIDTIDGKSTAYNAGTGVLPEYRGKKLSASLYNYCLAELKKAGIERALLEVIDENIPAKKSYEQAGLRFTRKIISYKGRPVNITDYQLPVKESEKIDWDIVDELSAWKPAWQYYNNTIKRFANNYTFLTAWNENKIMAFCIVNLKNGRIARFGSHDDKYLTALFSYIAAKIDAPLMIINVDESSSANSFITGLGLEHFITSWEMEKEI